MLLNVVESGAGDRVVLLLHGMMGSAESWAPVVDVLVERGDRVLALDLPGHGDSPRDPDCSVESAADAVVETVRAHADGQRLIAIGHSYGGTVLSAASDRLLLDLAVYVDTTCAFRGGADREALTAQYAADRELRSDPDRLRAARPHYDDRAIDIESRAAERFDPATAAAISSAGEISYPPVRGSILVRADPSGFVSDEDAARLGAHGVDVRSVMGAAHTIWYGHIREFVATLPEVFADI